MKKKELLAAIEDVAMACTGHDHKIEYEDGTTEDVTDTVNVIGATLTWVLMADLGRAETEPDAAIIQIIDSLDYIEPDMEAIERMLGESILALFGGER